MRVVSLLPSATEVVAGIGAEDLLVGRSHRCNYPPSVTDLPVVTESKLSNGEETEPGRIDAQVDDHRHGDGTFFQVLRDRLAELEPDVILTQSLCEVCAVPESMSKAAIEQLEKDPVLLSVGPTTIDELFDSIREVDATLEREAGAKALLRDLEHRRDTVMAKKPSTTDPPRVLCLEWTDALRCHGLWIPDILRRLDAEAGFGRPGERGRVIEWSSVRSFDPEVLIVSPCGRTLSDIPNDMTALTSREGWENLQAVRDGRVFLLDGELSSRHGPRVIRAMELIATMIYPDAYPGISSREDEAVQWNEEMTPSIK